MHPPFAFNNSTFTEVKADITMFCCYATEVPVFNNLPTQQVLICTFCWPEKDTHSQSCDQ